MSRALLPLAAPILAVVFLPGCLHHDQDHVAARVAGDLATLPRDIHTQTVLNSPRPVPKDAPFVQPGPDKLKLPPGLPGGDAPPIIVPEPKPNDPDTVKAIQAAYPALPTPDADVQAGLGPNGQPLDLPALQQIALANNPLVQQAVANVQAARGAAIQAGLHPNPTMGFQGDSMGQAGTKGDLGGFIQQTIKTGGKLGLASAAGWVSVHNAELALRRTQLDVMTQVRSGYFAVLVAHENMVITKAMSALAYDVYGLQVQIVQGGQAAAYEPLQLHVLAVQTQASAVQARNRYLSAWRQLAAALGQPELPPLQLTGRAEAIVPGYPYETIRGHMLAHHTDLAIAKNNIWKSGILLQLARAMPIPDVNTSVYVEQDYTAQPNRVQTGVQIGIQIPVFDANQGGILQAQSNLTHSNRDIARVENELSQRLAEAYERYSNSIRLAMFYRESMLPNQVRVYRGTYEAFRLGAAGKVNYNDVAIAQQALTNLLQSYIQVLSQQWQAIVDLAALLQTDDIYELTTGVAPGCAASAPVVQLLDYRSWAARQQQPTIPQGQAVMRATLAQPAVIDH